LIKFFDGDNSPLKEYIKGYHMRFFPSWMELYLEDFTSLYDELKDEKYKYRYKNFVCDYKRKEYYPTIRFSYDYGKTWKEYNTSDFTIESSIYGFYKDKYIIFEAAFMEKGAYIMIGEIMK